MNREFKMSNKAQRSKSLDLRRKVLLKNFFRHQGIYIYSSATVPGDSMDFSKSGDSILGNDHNSYVDLEKDLELEEQCENEDVSFKNESRESCDTRIEEIDKLVPDNQSQSHSPFTFSTMRTALPSSTSICSTESEEVSESEDSDACESDSQSSTFHGSKIRSSFRSKVKRKFSLRKPYSFSRRKGNETCKMTAVKRISKTKLTSKSIKNSKKTPFRIKFNEMFLSKSAVKAKKNKEKTYAELSAVGSEEKTFNEILNQQTEAECRYSDLNESHSIEKAFKSVSVQTNDYNTTCDYLENQRLRLENKRLKGKLQFLLSLNGTKNCSTRHEDEFNGMISSSDTRYYEGHTACESNQENKTHVSCTRLTRSRSIQESSEHRELNSHEKQRRCRRSKSVCASDDEICDEDWFYDRPCSPQPFKPVQSVIFSSDESKRKRKVSEPSSSDSDRSRDSECYYGKRRRSISTSYNPSM